MNEELENFAQRLSALEEKRGLGVWEKSNIIFSGIVAITSIFAIGVSIHWAKVNIKTQKEIAGLTKEKNALEEQVLNTKVADEVEKELQNEDKESIDTHLNIIALTSPKEAKGVLENLSHSPNIDISSSADSLLNSKFLELVDKIEMGTTKTDRTEAMTELENNWSTYPNFVPTLVEATNGKIQVQSENGLWNIRLINTLAIFEKIETDILLAHKNILNPWLSLVIEKSGPKTKARADLILEKLKA